MGMVPRKKSNAYTLRVFTKKGFTFGEEDKSARLREAQTGTFVFRAITWSQFLGQAGVS